MRKEGPKLLIVEDEPDQTESLRNFFRKRGFQITITASGKEAIRLVGNKKPDIILLDLKLADINGVDVLGTIKDRNILSKIIIVTGDLLNEERLKEIEEMGVAKVITKPVILRDLELLVKSLLLTDRFPGISLEPKPISLKKKNPKSALALTEASHDLSGLLNMIRTSCEEFLLNTEEGFYTHKTNEELLKKTTELMKRVIHNVDRATEILQKLTKKERGV